MKKNNMMRIASVLLVAVLLTSCVIAGTFAKYTSSASGEDTARVAYWGFNLDNSDIEFTNLFQTAYVNTEVKSAGANGFTFDGTNAATDDEDAAITVSDIIAPGTTNKASFTFAYTNYQTDKITAPEVAYTLDINTTGSKIAPAIKDNANIQWRLNTKVDTDDEVKGTWGSWDQLMTAIEALDGAEEVNTYAPNYLPSALADGTVYTVEWQWIFYSAEAADVLDTNMGNDQLLDGVKLVINIDATQVDAHSVAP